MTYPSRFARRTGRQEPRATASVLQFAARTLKVIASGVAMVVVVLIVCVMGMWLLGWTIHKLTGFEG